jgi:AcrR family transcriptional regulator
MFMNVHSPADRASTDEPPTGPPIGRRGTRALEIRGRLLDAAEALVAERQSAAITARDIAREAGVSDGVLYNHFADKHDLVVAALVRRFERLVATFRADLAVTADAAPLPGLAAGLERFVGASFRLHAAALPMLANVLSEPVLFRRFMVEIHRPPFGVGVFMEPLEEHLRSERRAGRVGDADPSAATELLVGSILLLALRDLVAPRPAEAVGARLREIVGTLVLGLAPRADRGPGGAHRAALGAPSPEEGSP